MSVAHENARRIIISDILGKQNIKRSGLLAARPINRLRREILSGL